VRGLRRQARSALRRLAVGAAIVACAGPGAEAQSGPVERTFHESKATIEKSLTELRAAMSGHLPTLEGFAQAGERPLNRYQRGFYQCTVEVNAAPSGGSVVRVSAKLTAWYRDPSGAHSGYQALNSNGRIESDLLDQLGDQLSNQSSAVNGKLPAAGSSPVSAAKAAVDDPTISAPLPGSGTKSTSSASAPLEQGLVPQAPADLKPGEAKPAPKQDDVQAEAASLEQVLKNQAHPRNLVAVKKSGTPVVSSPSLSGKTLFLASAQDEFEMLDFNVDWVHVRISGLSRGWIWRTSLEMPEGISDVPNQVATGAPTAADLFEVSREENAQFPGDWEPLRGKNVKIISVQKIRENEQGGGPNEKLAFAKSLLDKNYDELAKSGNLAGLVLIFDSADGGMIAATMPTIQKWKAGTLSDSAMWHQCYFDPPETFTISSASASR
jgi:hypothetical protein